jgi:hypothetical protein
MPHRDGCILKGTSLPTIDRTAGEETGGFPIKGGFPFEVERETQKEVFHQNQFSRHHEQNYTASEVIA